jgi:hypothetical protein
MEVRAGDRQGVRGKGADSMRTKMQATGWMMLTMLMGKWLPTTIVGKTRAECEVKRDQFKLEHPHFKVRVARVQLKEL